MTRHRFALGGIALVAAAAAVAVTIRMSAGGLERGEPTDVDFADLDISQPFVRVSGMAHYPVVIRQTVSLPFQDERTLYVFPLFAAHDADGRAVRVLVRTEREPDDLVSFEFMTLEGRVSVPTPQQIPYETEITLGKMSDYFFTEDMLLLEPWRVEVEGEPAWELQE